MIELPYWPLCLVLLIFPSPLSSSSASSASTHCDLRLNSSPQWFYVDGIPHYYDEEMNVCSLHQPSPSSSSSSSKKVYMLDFGDSFEWGACREHGSKKKEYRNTFIGSLTGSVKLCSLPNNPLQIISSRIYGIDGDMRYSNISSLESIAETSKVLSRHDVNVKTDVQVVTYGSFVWDLKHRHEKYCSSLLQKGNVSATLAANAVLLLACGPFLSRMDKYLSLPSSLSTSQIPLEAWSNYQLPWCKSDALEKWKKGYLIILSSILENFPNSKIALRTQAISGHVLYGNKHCYTPMNNFIRYIASLKTSQFLKLLSLFRVNYKFVASDIRYIAPDVPFALIDQQDLAVSAVEDDGETPRYAEDFIHLYENGGYRHYRLYLEKVALQLTAAS